MKLNWGLARKISEEAGTVFYISNAKQFNFNYFKLLKAFRNFYPDTNIAYSYKTNYLPKVGLYLSESKINYFLEDIPKTVKDWKQGKIIHYLDESNLKDMKIRFRGENPENWLKEKIYYRNTEIKE